MTGYPKCTECGEEHLIEKVSEVPSQDFHRCDYWLIFFCWHCGSAYAVPRRVHDDDSPRPPSPSKTKGKILTKKRRTSP